MSDFSDVCKLLRYWLITSTTEAGSGHLTSCLSSVELMAALFTKHYSYDLVNPDNPNNDRLIFSKGHAAPLLYSLYALTGSVTEKELMTLRKFGSPYEGHPTKSFRYTEVPTGSLGQGLSVGVGMAINAKIENLGYKTYVLLGDGEIAEGSVWEACEIASYYKLNNLVAIVDVNRLGQSQQTIYGYDLKKIEDRFRSFGFRTYVLEDGHNLDEVGKAYDYVISELPKGESPFVIIAKTVKGKGVSFIENENGWHGKALSKEDADKALQELGAVDRTIKVVLNKPGELNLKIINLSESDLRFHEPLGSGKILESRRQISKSQIEIQNYDYKRNEEYSTRDGYGHGLVALCGIYQDVIVLDADMKNSTRSEEVISEHPDRFLEMFIAEQNMVSVALGLSERGKVPFVSTFASFFTRSFDQIRIAHLSGNHIVLVGSHYGVSIGEDGPSQMGLEDVSIFRTLPNTKVFCPGDAVACEKIVDLAYKEEGMSYIRITKVKEPIIYKDRDEFVVGGSRVLKESKLDKVAVVAAGISVHEALKAYEMLKKDGIHVRIIDAYSIKPIDKKTIVKASKETKAIISVEDHYATGGLGDAVLEVLAEMKHVPIYKLAVTKIPGSGKTDELMNYEEISAESIVKKTKDIVRLKID